MALTRKMLKAMGIDEEKIDQIIEAHTETVEGLKDEAKSYKADAEKLVGVQKELDELKKDGGDWQSKYEKEHSDFEAYKSDITAKETKAAKAEAYRALLKDAGISEKRVDAIVKITDIDGIELTNDGKIKDAEERTKGIKEDYAEFIVTTEKKGADTAKPPANGGNGEIKTKEEIYKRENGRYVLSASERQAELAKLYQSEKGE